MICCSVRYPSRASSSYRLVDVVVAFAQLVLLQQAAEFGQLVEVAAGGEAAE